MSGPVGGRPTLPILGTLLLQVAVGTLSLTGTDLEMEMVARVALVQPHEPGATTVPARKFFDICRGLPEGAEIAVQLEGERMLVRSGRSRFSLSTLPALEMEMVARVALVQPHEPGATTVPARKFFDICRGLPEGAEIAVQLEGERMLVRSGRSRFSLSTLPAADFPNLDDWQSEVEFTLPQATMKRLIEAEVEFTLPQATMKRLIEATQFSMAHQDVRYYLNGMLFETEGEELRTVATDGHRLAVCSMPIGQSLPSHSVIT